MSGFARDLRTASAAVGVVPRLLSERPEEWRLTPFTVAIDARRGTAVIRYARIPVGRAKLDAGEIMRAWTRILARMRKASLPPDVFLPMLDEAYRTILKREGKRDGDRIQIAGLRDELRSSRYLSRYFSWDVARLRHEGRMAHAGRRIDLGVATGVPRKSRLIWIEDAAGGGQYYQTFRFAP